MYECAARRGKYRLDALAALDGAGGAGRSRLRTGGSLGDGDRPGRGRRGLSTGHGGRKDGEGEEEVEVGDGAGEHVG